jgi:predicted DNA-binding transcriptional regulator AlpA
MNKYSSSRYRQAECDVWCQIFKRGHTMHQAIYVTDTALAERFQVSRATIWRWAQTKRFPDPIKLSAGCTRWRLVDVEEWESRQQHARGARRMPDSPQPTARRVSTGNTGHHQSKL